MSGGLTHYPSIGRGQLGLHRRRLLLGRRQRRLKRGHIVGG